MLGYILRRILWFIPTLLVISLLAFIISINAPGDPVDRLLNMAENEGGPSQQSSMNERIRQQKRHELGLDLPVFYFSLGTLADPEDIHQIADARERQILERLSREYGKPQQARAYYKSLKALNSAYARLQPDTSSNSLSLDALNDFGNRVQQLQHATDDAYMRNVLDSLQALSARYSFLQEMQSPVLQVENDYQSLTSHPQSWRTYIPVLHFYGLKNQYHRWISGILLHADFGLSYRDQRPVMGRIRDKILWSFVLTLLSVCLAYVVSIPLGLYAAYRDGSFWERTSTLIVFLLYSLPNFFAGTLLLMLFANPDVFNWFPESGVQDPALFNPDWPFYLKIGHWLPYLILPLITYTYSSFAFLSRQMKAGATEIMQQDFVRTARAKGLPERSILWKHIFRNALLPIITVFSSVFPLAISGSIIVETIFSIPGMGLEIYESILSYDYPMIIAIFTLFGVLTLLGYLLADILYALADPRITYTRR